MRVGSWRRIGIALVAGGLAIGATACGDDDDGGSAATTASGAPPTTAAPATTAAAATTAAPATTAATATTAAPASTAAPATTGAAVQPTTLVVGHAYPDLAAFADVNPAFAIGDPEEQAQAVVEQWQTEGLLPQGVEIKLVQRAFDSLDHDKQLATCTQFAEEDKVDVLLVGRIGEVVANCAADQYQIPTIQTDPSSTSQYATTPALFTLRADESRVARSFIAWADEQGLLEGKTIGVFYDNVDKESYNALKQEIETRGYSVASEVSSEGAGIGSEQDQLAVQRFQTDGVDLAITMVGSSSAGNFQNFAQEQGATWDYIDWEYASHMSDTATLALNAEQYDGTRAVTSSNLGELSSGLNPDAQACADNWEAFSGKKYPKKPPETGESSNVLMTCDLMTVLLDGINNAAAAGGEINADSLIAGIEGIKDLHLAYWDTVSYGPDDHAGAETQREVDFNSKCQCFEIAGNGEFSPYPIAAGQ
jgi:hypothetical protein